MLTMFLHFALTFLVYQYNIVFSANTKDKLNQSDNPLEILYNRKVYNEFAFENVATKMIQKPHILSVTNHLKTFITKRFSKDFFEKHVKLPEFMTKPLCTFCKVIVKSATKIARTSVDGKPIKTFLYYVCSLIGSLLDYNVCQKVVQLNFDIIRYVLKYNEKLTPEEICAIVLQQHDCYIKSRLHFDMYIPPAQSIGKPLRRSDSKPFSILHFTDPHTDPFYKVGASTKCGRPLCCQKDDVMSENGAGHWGAYSNCDIPWHLFDNVLDSIVEKHNKNQSSFLYVYFTGDIINHRIWETSEEMNSGEIRRMYRTMKKKLGSVRVFPVVGNHEAHPVNIFHPPNVPYFSTQWLFDVLIEEWSEWLPKSAIETIRAGGYYSVLVEPGFRIISVNSNHCLTYNWWLLYDYFDPYDQLKWLINELLGAEANNEIVHILSHVPPGDEDCFIPWSSNFHRIVERFSHIIAAQFNGHTHHNELRIFYHSKNISQPINVAYNAGSVTTFSNVNPNYRIYDMDPTTLEVINYHEYTYQVSIANLFPDRSPRWYKLYSFKEVYGLNDLTLDSLDELVYKLARNKRVLSKYYRLKMRDSETAMTWGCNEECLKDELCKIVTTVYSHNDKCNELLQLNFNEKYF